MSTLPFEGPQDPKLHEVCIKVTEPVFEAYFSSETDNEPNMGRLAQVAKGSKPSEIVMTILQEIGLVPQEDIVETNRARAQELWTAWNGQVPAGKTEEYEQLIRPVTTYDCVHQLVGKMDIEQQGFWQNYATRTGQDTSFAVDLFDATDAYSDCSLLRTFDSVYHRVPGNERLQDAERIARLLILNEVGTEQ